MWNAEWLAQGLCIHSDIFAIIYNVMEICHHKGENGKLQSLKNIGANVDTLNGSPELT